VIKSKYEIRKSIFTAEAAEGAEKKIKVKTTNDKDKGKSYFTQRSQRAQRITIFSHRGHREHREKNEIKIYMLTTKGKSH
jgi:hypothetical protein